MDKIQCKYCKRVVSSTMYQKHLTSCEKIYINKDYYISQYQATKNLYKIACDNHISYPNLSYAFKNWNIKLNIDENGFSKRKYTINDNFFDEMSAIQYWLIGLIASDGCKRKHNQIPLYQSGENGLLLIKYVSEILNSTYPIRKEKTSRRDSFGIMFSSVKLVGVLEQYNIVRNKTLSYTLPDIPEQYFNAFLTGYIEGDGCMTLSKNKADTVYLSVSFVGTESFIKSCQKKIPIKCSQIRKCTNSVVYEIRWYGEKAIKFCDWLYLHNELYHSYKYQNYIIAKENFKYSKKAKYQTIKDEVLNNFKKGNVENIMKYAKSINVPFQTIYKWKKQWTKKGLL